MDARARFVGAMVVAALSVVMVGAARAVPLVATGNVVGYWQFDGSGATATDSSPNLYHGTFLAGASRDIGPFAGVASFPGGVSSNARVELPSNAVLDDVQGGDYTISAWVRADTTPPGSGSANDANYGIVIKAGWQSGLYYKNDDRFVSFRWHDVGATGATSSNPYGPGLWRPVVGVVSRTNGTIDLYVNGQPQGSASFTAGQASREYNTIPWRIGIANPGAGSYRWPMDGQMDEVVIWDTALSAAQAQSLHGQYTGELLNTHRRVADYRDDFSGPPGTPGWRYLWNPLSAPIGTQAGYAALQWTGSSYQSDTDTALPDAPPGSYIHLNGLGGHPGQGSSQAGDGLDHYTIAAFDVPWTGQYYITDSLLDAVGGGNLELRIYVEDTLIYSASGITGATTFHYLPLGGAQAGDTIYVAIGPNGHDGSDSFRLDFTIAYTPEPGTMALFGCGLVALARRRRSSRA